MKHVLPTVFFTINTRAHTHAHKQHTQDEMKTHEIMERELNLLRINHTSLQYKLAAVEEETKHRYD